MTRRGSAGRAAEHGPAEAGQRLDKWLVYARFVKTRSLAAACVSDGRVRLNGVRLSKPDREIRPGDVLTLALPHATLVIRVLSAAERRGSAEDTRSLYEVIG
jgi:ribosome-associated heat shock protein Hsp15